MQSRLKTNMMYLCYTDCLNNPRNRLRIPSTESYYMTYFCCVTKQFICIFWIRDTPIYTIQVFVTVPWAILEISHNHLKEILKLKSLTLTLSNRCLLKLSSSSIFGGKSGVKNLGKVKVSLFKRPLCVSIWPPNVVLRRDRGVISSGSALASGYRRYSDESSKKLFPAQPI